MKRWWFAFVLLVGLGLARAGSQTVWGFEGALRYPYGGPLPVWIFVDHRFQNDDGATTDLFRFAVMPVPFAGVMGDAQYRRYFAPTSWAEGSAGGYWNVGWVGVSHDFGESGWWGLYAGLGYQWAFNPRLAATLEGHLYPLNLLNGLTVPGSWGVLFSVGAKVGVSYTF